MNKTAKRKYRKCSKGELPKSGHIYFIQPHTAPKVFNGLYFECLLTDQKIPAYAKPIEDLGHIRDYELEIWKPERFGIRTIISQSIKPTNNE
jgi:hypothetical protein